MICIFITVNRVSWLRSYAIQNRWKEEYKLVRAEMMWTINYFRFYQQQWKQRSNHSSAGYQCYALRQESVWKLFGDVAEEQFHDIIGIGTENTIL